MVLGSHGSFHIFSLLTVILTHSWNLAALRSRGSSQHLLSSDPKQDNFKLTGNSRKKTSSIFCHTTDVITDEMSSNDVSYVSIQRPSPRKTENRTSAESVPRVISADDLNTTNFGSIFRQCAPYIAMHSGCCMVIHLGGQAMQNKDDYEAVLDDISILHLLGVQLVLVAGVRVELDNKLLESGRIPNYHDGMRITDEETMSYLKEVSGSARIEIESSLARGFRGRPGQSGINVVSGNFFYSAKPLGVRDGVDYKLTGEVRKVEVENLRKRLEAGDVVMLTSVGYSSSGEVFNVPSESLAAECAARLQAAKIIYMTDGEQIVDDRTGKNVQSLRLSQAVSLLNTCGIKSDVYNQVDSDSISGDPDAPNRHQHSKDLRTDHDHDHDHDPDSSLYTDEIPIQIETPIGLSLDLCGRDSPVAGYVRLIARCVI
jgi:acetylglutamate kinase